MFVAGLVRPDQKLALRQGESPEFGLLKSADSCSVVKPYGRRFTLSTAKAPKLAEEYAVWYDQK